MESHTYELAPLLAEIRDGYRGMRAIRASLKASQREERRASRAMRRSLRRDLAHCTSGSDLNLSAILGCYTEEETAEIRRNIAERRAA
ncbi:MAG TPA: hypothetical protein VG253_00755 [Streptosporangiaceae bacterium]|jgi:hypothetical protein|nr:hypothetical protein [Streptosporangiaceae bacterium]